MNTEEIRQHDLPKTVDEAVDSLIRKMSVKDKIRIINTEAEDLILLHFSSGLDVRNKLGLNAGNNDLLKSCGEEAGTLFLDPDDCSAIVLTKLSEKLKATAPLLFNWVDGCVDINREHISITYGDDSTPIAYLSPNQGMTFTVQFLVENDDRDKKLSNILSDVRNSLDYYLVELGEPNPWQYAIHHCRSAANIYSDVHWSYHSSDNVA